MAQAVFIPRQERDIPTGKSSIHRTRTREPEQIYPQQAPDPPRRGDVPVRVAVQTFVSHFFHPIWAQPDEQRLGAGKVLLEMQNRIVRGEQLPWDERTNIRRPPVGSYGQQFEIG